MRNNGPQSTNPAQDAAAQARRAALEAAAARRRAEAAEAARAASAAPAAAPRPAQVRDASAADGASRLESSAAVRGAVPLPPPPPVSGALGAELMGALGLVGPGSSVSAAMGFMRDLRGRLEGRPPVAAGAVTATMLNPRGFYEASAALKGRPEMAEAETDVRAVQAMTTADHLARQLQAEPDLSRYPAETVAQLASFREVNHPGLQAALDAALEKTFEGDGLEPEDMSKELAYLAHKSTDAGVKDALAGRVKAWADQALARGLDGKEKDSGVEKGLGEFQDAMIKLAERTGMGDVVQKAAEDALKDGEKLIEETAERGRSLWDKVTGAVSGFIDGAFGAIGDGIKKAIGAVGDVAEFAVDKVGDVAESGLDLAAAGLDAVGADGAADFTRKAGDAVDSAYDWVGKQADGFVDGVGAALGDTVTGIGTTIAHPIETVKGVAHLVANPGEIVNVAKAMWAVASEGGTAHAIGYIAGNLAPALLSGGSSSAATLTGRVGAIAGQSRVLTTLSTAAKASKAAQVLAKGGAIARGSALAQSVASGIGKAGALAGKARAGLATFVRESSLGRLAIKAGDELRVPQALEKFRSAKVALNDSVDRALGAQVQRLDNTALGRGVEKALPDFVPQTVTTEQRLAALAAKGPEAPIRLEADAQGVINERAVVDGQVIDEAAYQPRRRHAPDAGKNERSHLEAAREKPREIGDIPRERGLKREANSIQRVQHGERLQGTAHRPGAAAGAQPDIVIDFKGKAYQDKIGAEAKRIGARTDLTPEQKLQEVNTLVNRHLTANFTPDQIKALEDYHTPFNAAGKPISTEDYLRDGLADCRGYAAVHQMALQDAGFQAGISVSGTVLEDVGGRAAVLDELGAPLPQEVLEARGLSHYYNVVQIDGKQIIADAFNPAASGVELAEALKRGFVDRGGARRVHYVAGNYGATVLNDGLGSAVGGLAASVPAATAQAALQQETE